MHYSLPLVVSALSALTPALQAQVTTYNAFSSAEWYQTTANPSFNQNNAAFWDGAANVGLTNPGDAASGSLTTGGTGSPFTLTLSGNNLSYYTGPLASLSDLEAMFPLNNTYTFRTDGGSTTFQSGTLTMPATAPYPNTIPTFSNFANFTTVDPNSATFQWNFWTLPNTSSVEFFDVRNTSGSVLYSTFFTGPQTSWTVPNGILSPSSTYDVEVVFSSRLPNLGQWSVGSVSGYAGFDYRTSAQFSTVPEPGSATALAGIALAAVALARRRWWKTA